MSLEVGAIVEGEVTGITNFGAFVQLPENKVGLIHISEVSNVYVKDVHDFLKEHDKVTVKVLSVDERGKIGLSIKQLLPPPAVPNRPQRPQGENRIERRNNNYNGNNGNNGQRPQGENRIERRNNNYNGNNGSNGQRPQGDNRNERRNNGQRLQNARPAGPVTFEDKLSKFLKDSDDRMLDLKRNTESKRGGRGARRER